MKLIKNTFRYIFYILQIYIFYSLSQTSIFESLSFRPLAILCVFIFICAFENRVCALLFGIFIGIMVDMTFCNLIGLNAIVLGIIGYFLNFFFCRFASLNILNFIVFSTFTSFGMLYLNIFVSEYFIKEILYITSIKSVIISTMIISLPIYLFDKYIAQFLMENKNDKYTY